jgi:hypothetical protein
MPLLCESCGREMTLEFRVPRLGAPSACHDYYSCVCGFVTSQAHVVSDMLQAAEREISKIRLRLNSAFLKWARRADMVTSPPVPPKPVE